MNHDEKMAADKQWGPNIVSLFYLRAIIITINKCLSFAILLLQVLEWVEMSYIICTQKGRSVD